MSVLENLPAQLTIIGPGYPMRPRLDFPEAVEELDYQSRVFADMAWGADAIEPQWRTQTVIGLARGIYADRAGDRLPILADALEDAGCDNDIPQQLRRRNPAEWCRGEAVVDLCAGLRQCSTRINKEVVT